MPSNAPRATTPPSASCGKDSSPRTIRMDDPLRTHARPPRPRAADAEKATPWVADAHEHAGTRPARNRDVLSVHEGARGLVAQGDGRPGRKRRVGGEESRQQFLTALVTQFARGHRGASTEDRKSTRLHS